MCGCVYHGPNYINTHWLVRALYFPPFSLFVQANVCNGAAWASPIENYSTHTFVHAHRQKTTSIFIHNLICHNSNMLADRVCTSVHRANPWGQERERDREEREGNSLVLQTLPSLWSYPRARRFRWGGHGLLSQEGFYRKLERRQFFIGCQKKHYCNELLVNSKLLSALSHFELLLNYCV